MAWELDDILPLNRGGSPGTGGSGEYYNGVVKDLLNQHAPLVHYFGGRYLLDPDEVSGMGTWGAEDGTFDLNLGSASDLNSGQAGHNDIGGFMLPWDAKLTELRAIHDNTNVSARAWGWVVLMTEIANFNTDTWTTSLLLNEIESGVAPRDYQNLRKQQSLVTPSASDIGGPLIADTVIPAGAIVTAAIASPLAVATNYHVRVHSAYLKFERA